MSAQLDALQRLNAIHKARREEDSRLSARIESFELAYRMQAEAPEAFDVGAEDADTLRLYGVGEPVTDVFARQCLLARRLVERGVRIVQVYHTQTSKRSSCQLWDQHSGLKTGLQENCLATDQPVAALIQDLIASWLMGDPGGGPTPALGWMAPNCALALLLVGAAIALIDAEGIDALSMRALGRACGVEAMSLYRYVANKDELLDAVQEGIVGAR